MIISAVFGQNNTIAVTLNDGTVLWVPDTPDNAQRQELAVWVGKGNTIAPYVAPLPSLNDIRVAAIKVDAAYTDLLNRLKTATDAEIDAWFTANVTTLAQARGVLIALAKYLATLA